MRSASGPTWVGVLSRTVGGSSTAGSVTGGHLGINVGRPSPRDGVQDRVQNGFQVFDHIFSEKPQHQVPVTLILPVFPTVAAVLVFIQMIMLAIDFHNQFQNIRQQIGLGKLGTVTKSEWAIRTEQTSSLGQRFKLLEEESFGRTAELRSSVIGIRMSYRLGRFDKRGGHIWSQSNCRQPSECRVRRRRDHARDAELLTQFGVAYGIERDPPFAD